MDCRCVRSAFQFVVIVVIIIIALVLAMLLSSGLSEIAGGKESGHKDDVDDYPYTYKDLPPARNMFEALKAEIPDTIEYERGPAIARSYANDYSRVDDISSHYTERVRMRCRNQNKPSPYDVWQRIRKDLLGLSVEDQKEKIYTSTYTCSIFNPVFVRWIILQTAGEGAKVLDPSAGWGDRLIGSLAAGAVLYNGFDPNPNLQSGYRRIVDNLGDGKHDKFNVKEEMFEDVKLDQIYDIVITSPPYFSLEEYVKPGRRGAEKQSSNKYATYRSWINNMFKPYVTNAYNAVKPGGWVIIYISDFCIRIPRGMIQSEIDDSQKVGATLLEGNRIHYPLVALTESIMAELGATRADHDFGITVSIDGAHNLEKTRWALAWRKTA